LVFIDVQSVALEVLINLLVLCPTIFSEEEKSKVILNILLKSMKHQNYSSRIVESGLRFLALYAKNYPQFLRQVLEDHKAGESFLSLIEVAKEHETITHGISIITAVYASTQMSEEDNEKICKLLLFHCQSKSLRVICESLNALFDIYSDETYDAVLARLELVSSLENAIEFLYQKLEAEQKSYDEEEIEFFGETLYNLEEFLKYKRSHM